MKFFYIFAGILSIIAILIIYFQLLTGSIIQVPFFTARISVTLYTLFVIVLAFTAGVFLTLGIKWFMSWSEFNDDFDL